MRTGGEGNAGKARKAAMKKLHDLMDEQVERRVFRMQQAVALKDSTRLWDLITAAAESALGKVEEKLAEPEPGAESTEVTKKIKWWDKERGPAQCSGQSTFQRRQTDVVHCQDG